MMRGQIGPIIADGGQKQALPKEGLTERRLYQKKALLFAPHRAMDTASVGFRQFHDA